MGASGYYDEEAERRRIDMAALRIAAREERMKKLLIRIERKRRINKLRNERRNKREQKRRERRRRIRLMRKYKRISKNLFKKCIPYLCQRIIIPDLYIKRAADIRRKALALYNMHEANEHDDRMTGLTDLEGAKAAYYYEIKQKMPRMSIINHGARKTWWMAEKEKVNEGFKNEYYCHNNGIPHNH